jgi:very-short-patch-repair endonuclease
MIDDIGGTLSRMHQLRIEQITDGAEQLPYLSPDGLLERSSFESPIEALFAWAFMCNDHNAGGVSVYIEPMQSVFDLAGAASLLDRFCEDSGCILLHGPAAKVVLVPQARLGKYRADFLVVAKDYTGHPDFDSPRIAFVIECDGHDYHERTKEQAARDKSRDRALATAGLTVLRFTGSEIWTRPRDCADQAWEMAHASIRRAELRRG